MTPTIRRFLALLWLQLSAIVAVGLMASGIEPSWPLFGLSVVCGAGLTLLAGAALRLAAYWGSR